MKVSPQTRQQHDAIVADIKRLFGEPSHDNLTRYIIVRARHVGVARRRTYKSAVRRYLLVKGRPLSSEEDDRLNAVLEGIEVAKREPKKKRGAPSPQDVKEIAAAAKRKGWTQEAAAVIVGFGVGMRPREMVHLEGWQIDVRNGVVWVQRKCGQLEKLRKGAYEARRVGTTEALRILSVLKKPANHLKKVLPNLQPARVTQVVKEVALKNKWDEKLIWSGLHNMRHGRAADVYRMAMRAVQTAGGPGTQSVRQRDTPS